MTEGPMRLKWNDWLSTADKCLGYWISPFYFQMSIWSGRVRACVCVCHVQSMLDEGQSWPAQHSIKKWMGHIMINTEFTCGLWIPNACRPLSMTMIRLTKEEFYSSLNRKRNFKRQKKCFSPLRFCIETISMDLCSDLLRCAGCWLDDDNLWTQNRRPKLIWSRRKSFSIPFCCNWQKWLFDGFNMHLIFFILIWIDDWFRRINRK